MASAQNAELCDHLKAFKGGNLNMRALLDAMVKDPDQEEMYMSEIWEESEALVLRALVLPRPVQLSSEMMKLKESLGQFGKAGEVQGLKRFGEGVSEGSEERRKQAWNS